MFFYILKNYKEEIVQKTQTETYILKGIVKHAETMETLVLYEHKGKIWARPMNNLCDMFLDGKIKISESV